MIKTMALIFSVAVLAGCGASGDSRKPGTDPKFLGYWQEQEAEKAARLSTGAVTDPCEGLTVATDPTTGQKSIELHIQKISFQGKLLDLLPVTLVNEGEEYDTLGSIDVAGIITPSKTAVDVISKEVNNGLAQGAPVPILTVNSEVNYLDSNNIQIKQAVNATVLGKTSTSDASYSLARIPQSAFKELRARALACLAK